MTRYTGLSTPTDSFFEHRILLKWIVTKSGCGQFIQWIREIIFFRQSSYAWNWPPSYNAEVKNAWSYSSSTSHVLMAASCLFKDRKTFTFNATSHICLQRFQGSICSFFRLPLCGGFFLLIKKTETKISVGTNGHIVPLQVPPPPPKKNTHTTLCEIWWDPQKCYIRLTWYQR